MPELEVVQKISEQDLKKGRQEEMDFYAKFPAFEYVPIETYKSNPKAKYISGRWEDGRKLDGCVRCRWVLREFATKIALGDFFSATPNESDVDVLHVRAVKEGHCVRYFDVSRAFPHAPELEDIYSDPPAGFERPGFMIKMLRKINGRRDASQGYNEWRDAFRRL